MITLVMEICLAPAFCPEMPWKIGRPCLVPVVVDGRVGTVSASLPLCCPQPDTTKPTQMINGNAIAIRHERLWGSSRCIFDKRAGRLLLTHITRDASCRE